MLGASWAVERALRAAGDRPIHTLVAASAGNHGRAVAHVAARRGLRARVFLPARATPARRDAIAGEGAEIVVVDGDYEAAVAAATAAGRVPGALEIADVGAGRSAHDVIDGYATLFRELADQAPPVDLLLVPTGVGSLAAAAARHAATVGTRVVAVEPTTAPCLAASLRAGVPTTVPTPGTSMAGLDCAAVSAAAWPVLRAGIAASVVVTDAQTHAAMRELRDAGLAIGDCGAAALAALPAALTWSPEARRVALVATEGVTDPEGYAARVEVSPSR